MPIKDKNKLGKLNPTASCSADQFPGFSFRYITQNKNHNFDFYKDDNEKLIAYEGIFKKLKEISKESWIHWLNLRKENHGFETMDYSSINFMAAEGARLNKDSKVYVFRFDTANGTDKGRIIGYKESPCSVLNIIGFDFDFSAYRH